MDKSAQPEALSVFVLKEEGDAGVVLLRRTDLMEKSRNPHVEITEWYPVDKLHHFSNQPIQTDVGEQREEEKAEAFNNGMVEQLTKIVEEITKMGFEKVAVQEVLEKCDYDTDAALKHLMGNLSDEEREAREAAVFKQEMVEQLAKMGFNEQAVLEALEQCDDDMDGAMEHLMANHVEDAEDVNRISKVKDSEGTLKDHALQNELQLSQKEPQLPPATNGNGTDPALDCQLSENRMATAADSSPEINEENGETDRKAEAQRRKNQKKRAAKKRKKQAEKKKNQKSVSFGEVAIADIERGFGVEAVPAKGAWPLGLWETELANHRMSLDEYEVVRQKRLEARMALLSKRQRKLMNGVLETRQFDFKMSIKNPLFGILPEDERRKTLLEEEEQEEVKAKKRGGSRRSSSVIVEENDIDETVSEMTKINQEMKEELQRLRISRDNTGCTCSKVKNIDKLHQNKLKELLKATGCEFDASASKRELANQLKNAMEGKGMCELLSCECFRSGVQCHFDVCGCCFIMERGKKVAVNGAKKCGNPNGLYSYKAESVDRYRKQFFAQEVDA